MKLTSKVLSYIFHPLFIPTYFFLLCMKLLPYEFAGIETFQLRLKLFGIFWMTAFFPAFGVFLLWRLKFISNIYLETQKERIIPFFINMFFYWWMYYLSKNFTDQPDILKPFFLGIFASTAVGVVINNYIKISLHGLAIGGFIAIGFLTGFHYGINMLAINILQLLIAALVLTARLYLKSHTQKEIYIGLFAGIICQLGAYWFVF